VRKIRRLIELMKEYDLSEIDLQQGDTRIQLRRGGEPVAVVSSVRPVAGTAGPAPPPAETARPAPPQPAETKPEESHLVLIRSPMVGTFYSAPDPDSPAYVKVGDPVGPETVVCIVEAMKVFNQIPAEVSGKIVAVLVENGEPVEYGQPMFKVDTRQ
jgi:acetyl-CoA carboxylase biotin carboxyl carrier protein